MCAINIEGRIVLTETRMAVVKRMKGELAILGNRDLLYSAVWNLLQNAFKFTHLDTEVTLIAYALEERILIEVKDQCGGLPPGFAERMFAPFAQQGKDKTGLGLGLSIAAQCVLAIGGNLSVRDLPNSGCIFSIDIPRHVERRHQGSPIQLGPERRKASE
jgi:signal transduction histidine kinase